MQKAMIWECRIRRQLTAISISRPKIDGNARQDNGTMNLVLSAERFLVSGQTWRQVAAATQDRHHSVIDLQLSCVFVCVSSLRALHFPSTAAIIVTARVRAI